MKILLKVEDVLLDRQLTQEEFLPLVEEELGRLNGWLVANGQEPTSRLEKSMVATYLVQKYRGRLD